MKKIKLTESQLNKLVLNEGLYRNVKQIHDMVDTNPFIKTHPAAKLNYRTLAGDLYDAMSVWTGTDEDKILYTLQQVPDLPSYKKLKDTYRSTYTNDLLDDLDGDIDAENTWKYYVYSPMLAMLDKSKELNHLEVERKGKKVEKNPQVIENFRAKYPCMDETPGFEIIAAYKTADGKEQMKFKTDYGEMAVQMNGVAWNWDKKSGK